MEKKFGKWKMLLFLAVWILLLPFGQPGESEQSEEIEAEVHTRHGHMAPTPATAHCVMRINEFNTDTNKDTPSLFIELKRVCQSGRKKRRTTVKSMSNYYLVVIRAEPPAVTFFANLDGFYLNNEYLFTIGDSAVPHIDMDISHGNVYSIYKNPDFLRSLPAGDESPYAILLFDSPKSSDISRFRLPRDPQTQQYLEVQITDYDIQYIVSRDSENPEDQPPFLLDMVVYGRRVRATSCRIFDPLWKDVQPLEGGRNYLIRDWDVPGWIIINGRKEDIKDYSMNRCTDSTTGFSPTSFQYDTPSPGRPNPCQGVSFFFEDIANIVTRTQEIPVDPIPGCSADHPSVPAGRYTVSSQIGFAMARAAVCPVSMNPLRETDCVGDVKMQIEYTDEAMDIAVSNGEIEDNQGIPPTISIGGSTWSDSWIDPARRYLPNDGLILADPEVKQWLRIKSPGTETPISFHCAACQAFFKDEMGNVMNKKQIMTEKGYFSPINQKNSNQIRKHIKDDIHRSAMHYQYQLARAQSDAERDAIRADTERQYDEKLAPTARMVRTVLAEILSESPFMHHELFVNLQKSNGVELGFHHYSDKSAADITKTISLTMHKILLSHLVSKNQPFSLIVDTSTTKRNVPLLIVYIQTLEDGYPVVYLYAVIELRKGESAEQTFQSLWNSVLNDEKIVPGFQLYFTSKLAFFVSDSASVMVGMYNSLYTKLKETTKTKTLGQVGCMAHKMALVVKAAIRDKDDPDLEFIRTFEKNINSFYIFYSSRGSKRFQHLAETAEKYDIKLFRLRKNIEVRWATAEKEVIENILKDWELLEKDLKDISEDSENFTPDGMRRALDLHGTITDIATVVLYHEFMDFLSVNSVVSRALQYRASILADHAHLIKAAFSHYYNSQFDSYGVNMQNFIFACTCPGVCEKYKCELKDIEDCSAPVYKGVTLKRMNSFKLYPVRAKLYNKLFNAMSDYFDYDLLDAMTIFDHRQQKQQLDQTSYKQKFVQVCNTFSIKNEDTEALSLDCEGLSLMAYELTEKLMESETYKHSFGNEGALPPSLFWPFVLQNTVGVLTIDPKLKIFFQYLLVHSDSSAEAERGFSFINRIAKDARSGLSTVSLDALLRIKINADKPIDEFKAYLYAKEFAKDHFLVDDTTAGGRKPRKDKSDAYKKRASRLF